MKNTILSLYDSLPNAVCCLSTDAKILYANSAFSKLTNIPASEINNYEFCRISGQQKSELQLKFKELEAGEEHQIKFNHMFSAGQDTKFFEWVIEKYNNELPYLAVGWDITSFLLQEREMERDQYFFHLLMNNITDNIYFKDDQSRFLRISKAFADKMNLKNPSDIIGKTDFDIFSHTHAQQAFDDEVEMIKTGKILENIEEQETWMDGSNTWVSTTKVPYNDNGGKIIGTFGISRDITVRKIAQQALQESEAKLRELNAVKDKFFSIIAHDLRSPFHGLFGMVNLMLEDISSGGLETQNVERLKLIQSVLKNIFQLLEDLLEWGRIQSGAIQHSPVNGNIVRTIHSVINLFGINAKNKNIHLEVNVPDKMFASYDEKMISTVIRNLLTNGIKFTNPGGTIFITAIQENNNIKISVKDTGVGISDDNVHRLFNLTDFFTTKGTSNESGTGLGLILCKEFVEKHDGIIYVESDINEGSTFTFTIPL